MFTKVLVANRGEIALRVIRACQELGVATVAVHSDVDRESLHVKLADESVCIGPGPSRASYLSIPNLLSAAEITDADAIHPGYGFLAENAEFANVCEKCGVVFIGPTSEQISLMGDKIQARQAMNAAGLPMLESVEFTGTIDDATVRRVEQMGLPVIVKASAGGGGKGIKVVHNVSSLRQTLKTAQSEAMAAFGNGTVYVEKYLEQARHIEYQVVSDGRGKVIHLGERDCSLQRRHQKIIEEAPSIAIDADTRAMMGEKVVRAIESVGYRNLGTVEFLMDKQKRFYFLEMNTRVQVEHPVTEEVTGLDLIKMQISLAAGEPLSLNQSDIQFRGHAIEMRVNAEDPEKCLPSAGTITSLHTPGGPGVRVDSGVYAGFSVSPYYDSLLGKLIVHGATRSEAIARARAALREFLIEGIQTNIPLHQKVLSQSQYQDGDVHIRYIENMLKS